MSPSMFPLRVCVETVRAQHCLSCAHTGNQLVDTYAVVSGATLLSQLVDTVLSALGHQQLAAESRGLVQISNWKALPFDQITENPEETVDVLFKDLSAHITLRILTKPLNGEASHSSSCIQELKERLLKTVVSKHPETLASLDNKQIRDLIMQLIQGGEEPSAIGGEQINSISAWLDELESNQQNDRRSPVSQVRFNQLFEVPKLERWFRSDPSPSRQKLLNYMNNLNQSSYRRTHQKISYQQICNWFSNQRAARRPALAAMPPQQTLLPQATLPLLLPHNPLPDFASKFDYASLLESCKKSETLDDVRMDGGSDSPTAADDELHSNSDGGAEQGRSDEYILKQMQESSASSPDVSLSSMPMSLASSLTSSVTKVEPMSMPHQQHQHHQHSSTPAPSAASTAARSRLMFDPLSELPVLEKWFEENPHPTWMQIDQYTNILNSCPYRDNYPPVSQHNVKIWFKNRRAKCKRMQTGLVEKLFQQPIATGHDFQ